jgi:hypothetical protein
MAALTELFADHFDLGPLGHVDGFSSPFRFLGTARLGYAEVTEVEPQEIAMQQPQNAPPAITREERYRQLIEMDRTRKGREEVDRLYSRALSGPGMTTPGTLRYQTILDYEYGQG